MREWLEGHHGKLVGNGVSGCPFDGLWEGYRLTLLDGFVRAAFVATSPSVPASRRRFGHALG